MVSSSAQLTNGATLAFDSGSNVTFGQITASVILFPDSSGSISMAASGGSIVFAGPSGQSIMSISDVSSSALAQIYDYPGFPIFEVYADDRVSMGRFGTNALVVTGSFVGINTSTPA